MTQGPGGWARQLAAGVLRGERRALAQAISCLEEDGPAAREMLALLYPHGGQARLIGVTGAPGTGKSTLVNGLARCYRQRGLTVGILAVDPSSPFTGGALLGDRLRMRDLAGDAGVFIRSMATRGASGGLSRVTADAAAALDAAGYARIFIETVGAGQDEVEVARLAHTVIVVEAPGLGDEIQAIKAGILETAAILVVNKADRAGAEQTMAALRLMLDPAHREPPAAPHHGAGMNVAPPIPQPAGSRWQPRLLATVASEGRGIDQVVEAIEAHQAHLAASGQGADLEAGRAEAQLGRALDEALRRLLAHQVEPAAYRRAREAIAARRLDPYAAAEQLAGRLCGPQQAGGGLAAGERSAEMEGRLYVAVNDAERARLQTLVAGLSDGDLARPIGHGWTVGVGLAHLAFWDRRSLAALEEWERDGVRVVPTDPDAINDALLAQWLAAPPREVVAEVLAAAEAVDGKVESLTAQFAEAVLAQRPRSIIRAIHRREHLDEIERALAG